MVAESDQGELFAPEPPAITAADEALEEPWVFSVRLTAREVVDVAEGRLPDSLVAYCKEGLIALFGSPAEALRAANARGRTS